jgi:hypothetical protein
MSEIFFQDMILTSGSSHDDYALDGGKSKVVL